MQKQQNFQDSKEIQNQELKGEIAQNYQKIKVIDEEQIMKLENDQKQLRKKISNILSQYPLSGLYKTEDPNNWPKFYKNILQALSQQDGPRADAAKEIFQKMKQNEQEFEDLLMDIDCSLSDFNIKLFELKFRDYIPCQEYKDYQWFLICQEKSIQKQKDLKNKDSQFRKRIVQGLSKKMNQQEAEDKIQLLEQENDENLEQLEIQLQEKKIQLEQNVKYKRFVRLNELFKPLMDIWLSADQSVGKENEEKGSSLEKVLLSNHIFDLLIRRLKLENKNLKYFSNINWVGRDGEIDFVIASYQQIRNQKNIIKTQCKIECMIESKSRLFDIAHGYRQSGPDRDANKTQIELDGQIINVPFDVPCFIITTIPEFEYKLGMESKLKTEMQKIHLNKSEKTDQTGNVDPQFMFQELKKIFQNYISPQKWIEIMGENFLFVVDQ